MNRRSPLELYLADATATFELGCTLGRSLPPLTVLLLHGDLGAGKTTLVQGIGAGLGIEDAIVSPTFTLVNEYLNGRLPLYHLDLYRLESSEVAGIEPEFYWEGMEVDPGITAIEWAQRLPYFPSDYLEIYLSHGTKGKRSAVLKMTGRDVLQNVDLS